MQFYNYKRKRIKASDKSLVFCFYTGTLLSIFTIALLWLKSGQIMRTNLRAISLRNGITFALTPYRVFTLIITSTICISLLSLLFQL